MDRNVWFNRKKFEHAAAVVFETGAASGTRGPIGIALVGFWNAGHGFAHMDRENNAGLPYPKA